jgi:hypothetical protein
MMSGHSGQKNRKRNSKNQRIGGPARAKADDSGDTVRSTKPASEDASKLLKAALKVPNASSVMPPVDEVYAETLSRADDEVNYWQEDEVQKFLNANQTPETTPSIAAASARTPAASYLAGTFAFASPHDRSSLFAAPSSSSMTDPTAGDHCSTGPRSVIAALVEFVRGSVAGLATGSMHAFSNGYSAESSGSAGGVGGTECGAGPGQTWFFLLPPKRFVLRVISVLLYVCDALGVEAALTERTASAAHSWVEKVFSLPGVAVDALRAVRQSLVDLAWTLLALWWTLCVWWICLPYRVTMYVAGVAWSVFVSCLVMFLNRAPGGHRVLKALNGHIARH